MTIGTRVYTQHGQGFIVGKETPGNGCHLWLVRLDDGRETYYFPRELEEAICRAYD